jgi:hypothetical protein
VAELEPRMDQLSAAELDELEPLIAVAHDEYSAAAWALRDKLRARRRALTDADAGTEAQVEPDASVDPAQANAPGEPTSRSTSSTSRPTRRTPRPSSELSTNAGGGT